MPSVFIVSTAQEKADAIHYAILSLEMEQPDTRGLEHDRVLTVLRGIRDDFECDRVR